MPRTSAMQVRMIRHSLALLRRCSSEKEQTNIVYIQILQIPAIGVERQQQGESRLTFSVLHHNGGVLEEGDEEVAGLKVGI